VAAVARKAQSISTVKPPLLPRGEREQNLPPHKSIDEANTPGRRFLRFFAPGQCADAPKSISVAAVVIAQHVR
jgi:hypothetical protein